jgi:hypothetical protein
MSTADLEPADDRFTKVLAVILQHMPFAGRNMFLDCIGVLSGMESSMALRVWSAWWPNATPHDLLQALMKGALLAEDTYGRLLVHDLVCASAPAALDMQSTAGYGTRIWVDSTGKLVTAPMFQQVTKQVSRESVPQRLHACCVAR